MKKISINSINQIELSNSDLDSFIFDFNEYYHGYYPACDFTTAAITDSFFYAAGTDKEGMPHLFGSISGRVWEERNIATRFHLPDPKTYGNLKDILEDRKTNLLFLVSENGYLITLPDCPKCVRARKLSDERLLDGWIERDTIYVQDINGRVINCPLISVVQYRSSWDFAVKHLEKGGILLDLRKIENRSEAAIPYAINFSEEFLECFLKKYSKEQFLFFICERGYKADEAVRLSREQGFLRSYSLGSVQDVLPDLFQK